MAYPRIYADFHNLDDHSLLRLDCAGTQSDLKRERISLREGLVLTFFMDDADDQGEPDEIEVDGTVEYDASVECWVASVDWSKVRHASEMEVARKGE